MAKEQSRRDPSVPRSIGIWGDEPRKITLSQEPFDPSDAWSQLYSIYILGPFSGGWRAAFRVAGALRLERSLLANGRFVQTGRRVEQMISNNWLSTSWKAEHDGDPVATPRTWTFTSDLLYNWKPVDAGFRYPDIGHDGHRDRPLPMDSAKYTFAGRLEEDVVVNEGRRPVQRASGTGIASNWGLFDAVQRLEPVLPQPLTFDMLEDFDLYKPGHVLRSSDAVEVEFANGPLRLHGFRQLGHGILPWEYWVSDQGRLVLAVKGYQGYLLNPDEPIGGKLL
jgi:hypothetical protein